jgi:ubiquitin-activating enzyme E1
MPLHQWLLYENFKDCLPAADQKVTRDFSNDERHRNQVALFGREFQTKLGNVKLFQIGAGALGCEFLKQAALQGLCCGPQGELHCTDDDSIEVSNLNRQFLFRKEHVGKDKSTVACAVAKTINPLLNVTSYKQRVSAENEHIFTDNFFDKLDFLIGAVDNIHARHYVDKKSLLHQKTFFDSGTLGTMCNSQTVIPKLTINYGSGGSADDEEFVPFCTIRMYPYLIDHCIEYGRGTVFEGFFTNGSQDFLQFMENPKKYIETSSNAPGVPASATRERFEVLSKYADIYNQGYNLECIVGAARQLFQDCFIDQVAQQIHSHPLGHKEDNGIEFWTSPKRFPDLYKFDSADNMQMNFIDSVVKILKLVFRVKSTETLEQLRALADKAQPKAAEMRTLESEDGEVVKFAGASDAEIVIE